MNNPYADLDEPIEAEITEWNDPLIETARTLIAFGYHNTLVAYVRDVTASIRRMREDMDVNGPDPDSRNDIEVMIHELRYIVRKLMRKEPGNERDYELQLALYDAFTEFPPCYVYDSGVDVCPSAAIRDGRAVRLVPWNFPESFYWDQQKDISNG